MIKYFYKHSSDIKLERHDAYKPGMWVYVEAPNETELEDLNVQFGLVPRYLKDALDRYEIPRFEQVGEYTYVFTRFAYQTRAKTIQTAPVLFILSPDSLITVSSVQLPVFETMQESSVPDHATADPAKLMLRLLLQIDKQYDTFINDYTKQARHLRARLGKRDVGTKDFVNFVALEDDLNDFLSSLEPTNAALRRLVTDKELPAFAKHRDLVDTVLLNNEQSIVSCNATLKLIDSLRRTYALISSNNLDRSINWLSIAAVVIALPTLIYSLYGMNMPIPLQKEEWLFPVVVTVSVFSGLAVFVYGRAKRLF